MQFMKFNQSEIQSSLEYWTPERMANAIPAPFLQIDLPESSQQKYDEFSNVEEEMFLGCFPRRRRVHPMGGVKVRSVKKDPYRKAGRLYYRQGYLNTQDFYCTAQFVGYSNILLTAAHCLRTLFATRISGCSSGWQSRWSAADWAPGWSHSMVFSRACKSGGSAQETKMAIGYIALPDGWRTSASEELAVKYNYGFVKTVSPSNVGYLKLSKKTYRMLPYHFKAIGYPRIGGDHKIMYKQYGFKSFLIDDSMIMAGNDLDLIGSAGGAWFKERGSNSVIGINAFKDTCGATWGPAFGPETHRLMQELSTQASPKDF